MNKSQYDILLVEDDLRTIRLLTKYFHSKKITCQGVITGAKALQKLEHNIPKLIITDILHPPPSGYELCKKIKSTPKWKHIPVYFCSAIPCSELERHLTETKADGYILKPFKLRDFDAVLNLYEFNYDYQYKKPIPKTYENLNLEERKEFDSDLKAIEPILGEEWGWFQEEVKKLDVKYQLNLICTHLDYLELVLLHKEPLDLEEINKYIRNIALDIFSIALRCHKEINDVVLFIKIVKEICMKYNLTHIPLNQNEKRLLEKNNL